MSGSLRSVVYAAVLSIVCSLLLTAASSGLQPFQERNVVLDRHRNILAAAGLIREGRRISAADIEALYGRHIRPLRVDAAGRVLSAPEPSAESLPLYLVVKDGERTEGYIVPIDAKGLWGPINAYLAFGEDGSTVKGFTVYQHSETPGLGGEIEKKWFRDNWVGKKIATRQGKFVSVGVAKGRVEDMVPADKREHYVDGISGATLTGKYLAVGIRDTLSRYEPVAVKFRKNLAHELEFGLPRR
jgi:Na+-transporting NADH:ubiquinone oxidoreductase subunit C